MNLLEFIDSPMRNEWLDEPGISYYVRKSIMFKGAIELANCTAPEHSLALGFWNFIARYEDTIPFVVENVLNEQITEFFRRKKWQEKAHEEYRISQFASPLMVKQFGDHPHFIRTYGP